MTATTRPAGRRIAASDLRELADMLAPWSPEEFSARYWCRKPLYIKGSAAKLERLFPGGFSRPDFYRAARASATARSRGFQLLARGRQELFDSLAAGPRPSLAIQPEQMEWLFAAGANLRADNLLEPRIARFAAAIKAQLQHVGELYIAATLSPRGNGWPPHIDRTSVIFIQAEGMKRFTISPAPVATWPDKGALLAQDGSVLAREGVLAPWEELAPVDMGDVLDVVLEPGDVLFLPPGTIHGTEALSEASLTIDVLFGHASALDVVVRVLEGMLRSDPNWRHLPAVSLAEAERGRLPPAIAEFMGARLAELRAAVDALTPASLALNREWQRSLADAGEVVMPLLGEAPPTPPELLQPHTRLRLSRRAPATIARGATPEGVPCVDLYHAGKEVNVVGAWAPFVEALADVDAFEARDAMHWGGPGRYPRDAVRDNLEALLAQGILERD